MSPHSLLKRCNAKSAQQNSSLRCRLSDLEEFGASHSLCHTHRPRPTPNFSRSDWNKITTKQFSGRQRAYRPLFPSFNNSINKLGLEASPSGSCLALANLAVTDIDFLQIQRLPAPRPPHQYQLMLTSSAS
jgi:hypothetical protein